MTELSESKIEATLTKSFISCRCDVTYLMNYHLIISSKKRRKAKALNTTVKIKLFRLPNAPVRT